MAQIYVNSGLAKPKGIHIYNSSTQLWDKSKGAFVRVNGTWIPFMQYLKPIYDNGVKYYNFIKSGNYAQISYAANYMSLSNGADETSAATGVFATDAMIDVTNFSSLKLDAVVHPGFSSTMYLIVSTVQLSNWTVYDALIGISGTGITSLNVSSLTGSFYVRVVISSNKNGGISMDVKKLWLE